MPRMTRNSTHKDSVIDEDNSEIKTFRINGYRWKMLCKRHIQHHCLLECPVYNTHENQNSAIKFEKNILESAEKIKTSYRTDNCITTLPNPIMSPNEMKNELDPCVKLLFEKNNYEKTLSSYRSLHKRHKKNIEFEKNKKFQMLPKYLVDLSKGVLKDPDPLFKGSYDWYYTGGIIDTVKNRKNTFIIYPMQNDNLGLIELQEPYTNFVINCGIEKKTCAPIYRVKTYNCSEGFVTLVRKKRDIFLLYSTFSDDNLLSDVVWKQECAITPYIDFRMDQLKFQTASLDLSHTILLSDIESSKTFGQYNQNNLSEELPDQLSQIDFSSNNTILFANRKSIQQIDLNSGETQKINLGLDSFNCDNICCFNNSKSDRNSIFVATIHNIYKMDLRQLKSKKYSYLNKWSHMMTTPPIVMTNFLHDETEYFYLCGPNFADKVLLPVSQNTEFPIYVNNVNDTFRDINLSGNVRYGEEVLRRVKLSNAGNAILKTKGGEIKLITANSLGDIFEQNVLKNTSYDLENNEKNEKFVRWLDAIPKTKIPMEITGVCNMSSYFFDIVNEDTDEHYLKKLRKENKHVQRLKNEFFEMNLVDPKFKAMNSIWEDDEDLEDQSKSLVAVVTPKHKVAEWLQSTNDNPTADLSGYEYTSDIQ